VQLERYWWLISILTSSCYCQKELEGSAIQVTFFLIGSVGSSGLYLKVAWQEMVYRESGEDMQQRVTSWNQTQDSCNRAKSLHTWAAGQLNSGPHITFSRVFRESEINCNVLIQWGSFLWMHFSGHVIYMWWMLAAASLLQILILISQHQFGDFKTHLDLVAKLEWTVSLMFHIFFNRIRIL